eukprot:3165987-Alexandrium_andersonii.AAC.1
MCIRDRGLCVQRLPARRCRARAMQAAPKLGARPRLGNLRREGDVHVLIDVGTEVRLSHVDKQSLPGPAPAT